MALAKDKKKRPPALQQLANVPYIPPSISQLPLSYLSAPALAIHTMTPNDSANLKYLLTHMRRAAGSSLEHDKLATIRA